MADTSGGAFWVKVVLALQDACVDAEYGVGYIRNVVFFYEGLSIDSRTSLLAISASAQMESQRKKYNERMKAE